MITIKYYSSKEERKNIAKEFFNKGQSMIHDDFISSDGKTTDGNSGKLTFDIVPENTEQKQKMLLQKQLTDKLKNNTITFEELKELLRLRL